MKELEQFQIYIAQQFQGRLLESAQLNVLKRAFHSGFLAAVLSAKPISNYKAELETFFNPGTHKEN